MDLDASRRVVGAPATLRLLVHADEERDVRELGEGPRAERPRAASFLVIRQLAIVAFHLSTLSLNSSAFLAKL